MSSLEAFLGGMESVSWFAKNAHFPASLGVESPDLPELSSYVAAGLFQQAVNLSFHVPPLRLGRTMPVQEY